VIESVFFESHCDGIVIENIGINGINRKGWNSWNEYNLLILKRVGETIQRINHLEKVC
jgi:hypothetical protein